MESYDTPPQIRQLNLMPDQKHALKTRLTLEAISDAVPYTVNRISHSKGRIILICDNARYNHARLLKTYLQDTHSRVELILLPPYSPNLNLIERLRG